GLSRAWRSQHVWWQIEEDGIGVDDDRAAVRPGRCSERATPTAECDARSGHCHSVWPKVIVQSRRRRSNIILDDHVKAIPVLTLLSAVIAGAVAWYQNSDALRLKEQAGSLAAELASKHAVGQQQETLLNT